MTAATITRMRELLAEAKNAVQAAPEGPTEIAVKNVILALERWLRDEYHADQVL